jgi:hypothetical protein
MSEDEQYSLLASDGMIDLENCYKVKSPTEEWEYSYI